jgi:hypothetical protein
MNWAQFEAAVARRQPVFWWRDDDATAPTAALERLLGLAAASGIPLALAVIPMAAQPGLFSVLKGKIDVLQHGADHTNRAGPGAKKSEFPPHERAADALARLAKGGERLRALAGGRALPVLAPPWNRFRADLLAELPGIGLRGLSAYGARAAAEPAPGLVQINTHVDIVAWQEGRRFVGETNALALAVNCFTRDEPIGWLTHHAVHDEAAWRFLERLFSLRGPRWASAAELFSYTRPAHG